MFDNLVPLVLLATLAASACVPVAREPQTTTAPAAAAPVAGSVRLHPNGRTSWCLEVQGNKRANGTPVQLAQCSSSSAQAWTIKRGSTQVKLAGTNFCLDAGSCESLHVTVIANHSAPGNGVKSKIWQCYDGLAAQRWWYTDDNRIALEGKGQCVDLPSGGAWAGNVGQTWHCSDGNSNQVWTTSSAPAARRDVQERACSVSWPRGRGPG